jgi:mRNA interferase YafQ
MSSRKSLKGKAAKLPRRSDRTKELLKDWQRLQHAGINLAALKEVMTLLIAGDEPLGAEWRDHPLQGVWDGHRECHAGGDLLLIYQLRNDDTEIVFVRAGSHAELFRK